MGLSHLHDSRLAKTIEYYQVNAASYAEQTQDVDMQQAYDAFLLLLPNGGTILDIGCGSGRDLKYFKDRGYDTQAIEPAPALAEIARERSGALVREILVEDLTAEKTYDGIWACASLLHIPRCMLPSVINRLINALKPGGVLYMCFKKGVTDHVVQDGRLFNDQTCKTLSDLVSTLNNAIIIRCWESKDLIARHETVLWTNMLVQRDA